MIYGIEQKNLKTATGIKMVCPKCRKAGLKHAKVKNKNVKIDYCTNCKGMWFEKGEFEEAFTSAIKDLDVRDKSEKAPMLCPACFEQMYRFDYPQTLVTIDMCVKCKGLWLEAGEAKEIDAIRKRLAVTGQAEEYCEPTGVKGALIRMIESAIFSLTNWEDEY